MHRRHLFAASFAVLVGTGLPSPLFAAASKKAGGDKEPSPVPARSWKAGARWWKDFEGDVGNLPGLHTSHADGLLAATRDGDYVAFAGTALPQTNAGLQICPARSNLIGNSSFLRMASGAVPGYSLDSTSEGITASFGTIGVEGGLPFIELMVAGRARSDGILYLNLETVHPPTTRTGDVWTLSAFCRLAQGSFDGTIGLGLQQRNDDKPLPDDPVLRGLIPSKTLVRYALNATVSAVTANAVMPYLWLTVKAGTPYDFVLRIAAPQLERGSYASAPILTRSGTPVNSGGDIAVMDIADKASTGASIALDTEIFGMEEGDWLWVDRRAKERDLIGLRRLKDQFRLSVLKAGSETGGIDIGRYAPGRTVFAVNYGRDYAAAQLIGRPLRHPLAHGISAATEMVLGAPEPDRAGFFDVKKIVREYGEPGPHGMRLVAAHASAMLIGTTDDRAASRDRFL